MGVERVQRRQMQRHFETVLKLGVHPGVEGKAREQNCIGNKKTGMKRETVKVKRMEH